MTQIESSYKWVLLALTLWREARGCTHDEKRAVAHVIVNRATDPKGRFPKSIVGVIIQPMQFTSIAPPSHITPAEMANATTWPKDGDIAFSECCAIAESIGNATDGVDPTNGATNYYSDPISEVPVWADVSKMTLRLGPFHFFKL